jgi:hypothetical protein
MNIENLRVTKTGEIVELISKEEATIISQTNYYSHIMAIYSFLPKSGDFYTDVRDIKKPSKSASSGKTIYCTSVNIAHMSLSEIQDIIPLSKEDFPFYATQPEPPEEKKTLKEVQTLLFDIQCKLTNAEELADIYSRAVEVQQQKLDEQQQHLDKQINIQKELTAEYLATVALI